MKNLILVSVIGSLLFLGTTQSFAQNKGQEKKEQAKEKQAKAQDKKENAQYKQGRAENKMDSLQTKAEMSRDSSGNAYGKNKGDMTGKEFGQYRAEVAQNKAENVTNRLSKTDSILTEKRENLKRLKKSLEEDARRPNVDKKEIEERRVDIDKAENKLLNLEVLLDKSREKLKKTEEALKAVTQDN